MIIEDSRYGRIAAQDSGCNLMPVKNLKDVTLDNINKSIKLISNKRLYNEMNEWEDKDMNILIPMAGATETFC